MMEPEIAFGPRLRQCGIGESVAEIHLTACLGDELPASTSTMRAFLRSMRRKSRASTARQLGRRLGQLDPGRPAADDDQCQEPAPLGLVLGFLDALQGRDDAPVNSRKSALSSLRSSAGASGCDGIVENFSVSSSSSASSILIPRVSASIFITAAPISLNGTSQRRQSRLRNTNEVGEPEAHGGLLVNEAFERRLQCLKIETCLIDIKDDQRESCRVTGLRFVAQ